jgi:hypothetical protein
MRIKSSNYDPTPYWNYGAQIIALNFQTMDINLRINQLKFAENGNSGYLLKPRLFEKISNNYNPNENANQTHKLNVSIISGVNFPKNQKESANDITDPYVKIIIYGKKIFYIRCTKRFKN